MEGSAAIKPSSLPADIMSVSDAMPDPGRPTVEVRQLLWLLLVLAGVHASAAVAGMFPGGSRAATLADACLAAVILAAVILAVVAAVGTPAAGRERGPSLVEAAAVLAICLAGAASGLRAAEAGGPWAGGDVVVAVLVAVALPSRRAFWTAVGGALVTWAAVQAVGATTGTHRVWAWALSGTVAVAAAAVAVVLRGGQARLARAVAEARVTAQQQAVTDPLTRVANRRGLELMASPMIEHARRQGEAAHCLFLDLDGFRVVNDMLGRSSGDEVLTAVTEALVASARATDVVARWAGDQFVVLGPGTGTSPLEMERRVRGHLHENPPVPPDVWDGRVSIGSATLVPWDEGNLDSLLHRAEEDMQLRRSLRRQSRARSMAAPPSGPAPVVRAERRNRPPQVPPASPSVQEER